MPVYVAMEEEVKRQASRSATKLKTISECTPETVVQYDVGCASWQSKEGVSELGCWSQFCTKGGYSDAPLVVRVCSLSARQVQVRGGCFKATNDSTRASTANRRNCCPRRLDLPLPVPVPAQYLGREQRRHGGSQTPACPTEAAARSCQFAAGAQRQTNNCIALHWNTCTNRSTRTA